MREKYLCALAKKRIGLAAGILWQIRVCLIIVFSFLLWYKFFLGGNIVTRLSFFGGNDLFQKASTQVGVQFESEGYRFKGTGVHEGGKNDRRIENQSFTGSIIVNC